MRRPEAPKALIMKIENTAVTLNYKVADAQGKLVEESSGPMVYLHGGYGNTLPKIEETLDGKEPGYQVTLELQPEDAFGLRDESLVRTIPKTEFPPASRWAGSWRAAATTAGSSCSM